MTAAEFTLELFSRVDDALSDVLKHPLAHLHPSEVVTIGILQALRGDGGRAFYRWLKKELGHLFPRLPERTRLFRLLVNHGELTRRFLAQPTFFGVCNTYGIELIHPIREGRSETDCDVLLAGVPEPAADGRPAASSPFGTSDGSGRLPAGIVGIVGIVTRKVAPLTAGDLHEPDRIQEALAAD